MRKDIVSLLVSFAAKFLMAGTNIHYQVRILAPQTHYAEVSVKITNCSSDNINFIMPVWTPGSYLIREFERNVERVQIRVNESEISPTRPEKNIWHVSGVRHKNVTLTYSVYAFENTVRTSFIDADEAFLHNTSLLMLIDEFKNQKGTIEIFHPTSWKTISTTLPQTSPGVYEFKDYDDLADSPIQIGNHQMLKFSVSGVEHQVALVGVSNCDTEKFTTDLQKMCECMSAIVGVHPCEKYLFIVKNVETGGGGLEHANSCTVMMPRWNWTDKKKYESFLGLCAHEYFHLWNVKRIRPVELGPFDYSRENYTDLLWVAEGITSYYDELAMLRTGYINSEEFLNVLSGYINKVENRPGTRVQSLAQSSQNAWIKEYRPDENSANTSISYYTKGLVIAALLDVKISTATQGKSNLDDLMKFLYKTFYLGKNRGFSSEEFIQSASAVAGIDMGADIKQWMYSTEAPDYAKTIEAAGILATVTSPYHNTLGVNAVTEGQKCTVKEVLANSPAWLGGINARDEIVFVNDFKCSADPDELIHKLGDPDTLVITINRNGLLRQISVQMKPTATFNIKLHLNSDTQNDSPVIKKWLGL